MAEMYILSDGEGIRLTSGGKSLYIDNSSQWIDLADIEDCLQTGVTVGTSGGGIDGAKIYKVGNKVEIIGSVVSNIDSDTLLLKIPEKYTPKTEYRFVSNTTAGICGMRIVPVQELGGMHGEVRISSATQSGITIPLNCVYYTE